MDNAAYDTQGVCLTGQMQIEWIQMLVKMPKSFVLHADGKHKLHHGKWILMTVGVHYLCNDGGQLVHTFVALMYLMTKNHETGGETHLGSSHMLIDSLNAAALKYGGAPLVPGCTVADHCAS